MMGHDELIAKRIGCSLMLITQMLFRVRSHGSISEHLWSLQKNNFTLNGNILKIHCIYGTDPYEVDFELSQFHRNAFNVVLSSTAINEEIFSAEKQLVKTYVWTYWEADLDMLRRAAVTKNVLSILLD